MRGLCGVLGGLGVPGVAVIVAAASTAGRVGVHMVPFGHTHHVALLPCSCCHSDCCPAAAAAVGAAAVAAVRRAGRLGLGRATVSNQDPCCCCYFRPGSCVFCPRTAAAAVAAVGAAAVAAASRAGRVGVHMVPAGRYCARVNSVQAFGEVNRDVSRAYSCFRAGRGGMLTVPRHVACHQCEGRGVAFQMRQCCCGACLHACLLKLTMKLQTTAEQLQTTDT